MTKSESDAKESLVTVVREMYVESNTILILHSAHVAGEWIVKAMVTHV